MLTIIYNHLLLLAACIGGLALIFQAIGRFYRQRSVIAQHGCQRPVYENSWLHGSLLKPIELVKQFQRRNILPYFSDLFHRHGNTFISRVLWLEIVVTCDPENIKHILQGQFDDFDVAPLRHPLFLPVTPHGILRMDGAPWRTARKMFRTQLTDLRSVLDLESLERQFQLLLAQIPRGGTRTVDIQELFFALTTDWLSVFAIGSSPGPLSLAQKPEEVEVMEAIRYVKERIARFGQSGPGSWLYNRAQFHKASALVRNYIGGFVREAMQKSAEEPGEADKKRPGTSFVTKAVQDGHGFESVRDQAITVYLAGTDSVTSLLSSTFWFLAKHPQEFDALKSEVQLAFGSDPPIYDDLRSIARLQYIFNEGKFFLPDESALRVLPTNPFNAKTANKDTWLPRGGGKDGMSSILIRKGQAVSFWAWESHRNTDIFGPDPEAFRPDRWANVKRDAPGYIPFQPGPRVCPGQHLALAMASYVAIRMVQSFNSIESTDSRAWTEKLGISLNNRHGVLVSFK
ncbi:putative cytochrome P450 oxidoreductase/alkane hydroxylase [Thozetella sp. PMI_491]|nr:putative cytochrome P450 oxidoreductase/alkane hydroxylase [Thozetella sp. PMI_491]